MREGEQNYICNMLSRAMAMLLMVAGAWGCQSEQRVAVVERHEPGNSERSVARLEIEGMMCEVACGGKISKELIEVSGVAHAQIDFYANRLVNFVEVEFDPRLVEPEALASAVNGIADGRLYKVHEVDVTHFAQEASLATQ